MVTRKGYVPDLPPRRDRSTRVAELCGETLVVDGNELDTCDKPPGHGLPGETVRHRGVDTGAEWSYDDDGYPICSVVNWLAGETPSICGLAMPCRKHATASLDIATGNTTFYGSTEEFMAALAQLDAEADPR